MLTAGLFVLFLFTILAASWPRHRYCEPPFRVYERPPPASRLFEFPPAKTVEEGRRQLEIMVEYNAAMSRAQQHAMGEMVKHAKRAAVEHAARAGGFVARWWRS